jgi:signal peptide peptidase SppA
MRLPHDPLWAGTETSLQAYLDLEAQAEAKMAAGWVQPQQQEEEQLPYLLSIDNGIGRVRIHGPLTNKEAWYNEYLGIASYGAIREAMIAAASHPDVSHIVLDINSGGGAVNGVSDTADLIRLIHTRVKPVTAFTDGTMASAAYWLGAAAGKVYSSTVSTVGSIGVISTHMEYSQQLKQEGINVTVMRAGKYKALANGYEPLSDTAKAQLQGQLDAAYQVFVSHVAQARGQSYDYVDANMAQGREFFGRQALAAGLVDGIESYDSLINKITADAIDKNYRLTQNASQPQSGINNMNKKALSEQDIAALAAGAAPHVLESVTGEQTAGTTEAETTAQVETTESPEAAEAAAQTESTATTAHDEGSNALVAFLQGEVKAKDDALLQANVKIAQLEAQLADQGASHQSLLGIAIKSVQNMQVALGGSAIDMNGMTATAVLAEHKRMSEQFQSKFQAGGVAAVDAAQKKDEPAVQLDPLYRARLDAARFSTAK